MRVALFLARSFISWLGAWPASAKTRPFATRTRLWRGRPPAVHLIYLVCVCASYCSRQKNRHRSGSCKTIHRGKKKPAPCTRPLSPTAFGLGALSAAGGERETRKKAKEKALSSRARGKDRFYSRASSIHISGPRAPPLDCGIKLLGTQQI